MLPGLNLSMGRYGYFQDQRGNIKIIWRGLSQGEEDLKIASDFLTQQNIKILEKNKLIARSFKGHITIGRVKRNSRTIDNKILKEIEKLNNNIEEEKFSVKEFYLYKSELTPSGFKYELIETFKFKDRK